ncbi:purine-cytosine permease family protein [Pseudonocardia lacus]|uniref:purine-cytosine permease family protein n=1 Tax=Pseudonocardia lacus TaxID=2835865 RepID=UPI001BDC9F3A|nr:cytosine permease [Pseudonocardia lacus]
MGAEPKAPSVQDRVDDVGGRGGIERHGVDRIPDAERTSSPGTFAMIFIGSSVGLGAVAFGWIGMGFGLGVWDTIAAIAVGTVVGQLLLVPLILLGSRTATNDATASGATFGVRGRLIGSAIGLLSCLFSVALTTWTSGSAGVAVAGRLLGTPDTAATQAVAYAVVLAVSAAIAIWGYRWLVRANVVLMTLGGLLLLLMLVAFGGAIDWGYAGSEPVLGSYLATWLLVATTIGVSGALVVCTIVGDWTRYIRSDRHSTSSLAWIGSIGVFIGFVVPAAIGALVSTSSPAFADPSVPFAATLANEAPAWYAVLLLPLGVLGGVGLVASSLYSAGLDLDALVVRLTRPQTTTIIAVVAVILIYLAVASPNIIEVASAALLVMAELAAPWAVIIGINFLRTGGHYDPDDLQVFNRRETGGRYWFTGGWNWPATLAWAVGSIAGLLTIQTLSFTGPFSDIAGGVDISLLLGAVVAAAIYLPFSGNREVARA